MTNMRNALAVAGGLALVVLSPVAAHADSSDYYVDNAISALQGGSTYIGTGAVDGKAIADAIDNAGIGVAVLPQESVGGALSSADIAQQILAGVNGQYTTILVYQDGGRPGFASTQYDATTLSTAAYAPFNDGGSLTDNIVGSIDAVEAITSQPVNPDTPSSSGGGFSATDVLFPLGGVIAVVVAGTLAFRFIKNRSSKPAQQAISSRIDNTVPDRLSALMRKLQKITYQHSQLPDDKLSAKLNKVLYNLQELFKRIKKKGTPAQIGVAEVEYVSKLNKLNEALGEDYYLDILKNPEIWDDVNERLSNVEKAVDAVQYQLIENIKQVNASRDLQFQAAIESLIGPMEAPSIHDIYRKEK